MERQRLIYKGRILSDNARTLADYGIGAGDSNNADGIVIYLVKGSAPSATTAGGGTGGGVTAPPTSSTPAAAPPTQPNNPFMNFGATGGNAANPMANLMNSMGGGMPDMATFQREMMNNPQMMQEMMNNPMVSWCVYDVFHDVACSNNCLDCRQHSYSFIYPGIIGSINHEQSRLHAHHDGKQPPNASSSRIQPRITTCITRSRIYAPIHGNDERSKCNAEYDEESRFGNESD